MSWDYIVSTADIVSNMTRMSLLLGYRMGYALVWATITVFGEIVVNSTHWLLAINCMYNQQYCGPRFYGPGCIHYLICTRGNCDNLKITRVAAALYPSPYPSYNTRGGLK